VNGIKGPDVDRIGTCCVLRGNIVIGEEVGNDVGVFLIEMVSEIVFVFLNKEVAFFSKECTKSVFSCVHAGNVGNWKGFVRRKVYYYLSLEL